jgi:DNA-binding beta-propeller fold protein YncE
MNRLLSSLCLSIICFSTASSRADKLFLVAGGGSKEDSGIPAMEALLKEPFGTGFDVAGRMWIIEMASGNRLLLMSRDGLLTHVAGQPKAGFAGDGGPGLQAQFNGPHNLAVLPDGDVLIGDTWNGRIRRVNGKTGVVTSVKGYEVPLEKAKGSGPYCITLDFTGAFLYVANLQQVLMIDLAAGTSKVIAGNGKKGVPEDGAIATEAPLVDPRAVAPDRLGNVYILERGGNALRVVDKDGRIRTVVNASGKKGAEGDGGPALEATLNGPKHLCVDNDNSVVIADAENNRIRRYQPANGKIYQVAGTGKMGAAGLNGDPRAAELARPHGVTINPVTGELYITDSYNNRILKIKKELP